jgi:homoaconitase/3-isopropylmalate dehydratase large subunit
MAYTIAEKILMRASGSDKIEPGKLMVGTDSHTTTYGAFSTDLPAGTIKNLTTGKIVTFRPLSPFVMEILESGGLVEHLNKKQAK